ncbi:hypothetical protein GQ43DRAFT_427690 [Delitschia confertaspora ATCC 74209]|uniref:Secreted protein n=1 Tax=Delitschia confertaspora ATCC 74209 TaxID=1513339 RepID=A0A9P4JWZ4_9PLEO|nr:hypothetical protein GQ43DRAFT_427690 [Delitschia confertaspora ATCC 74209]
MSQRRALKRTILLWMSSTLQPLTFMSQRSASVFECKAGSLAHYYISRYSMTALAATSGSFGLSDDLATATRTPTYTPDIAALPASSKLSLRSSTADALPVLAARLPWPFQSIGVAEIVARVSCGG